MTAHTRRRAGDILVAGGVLVSVVVAVLSTFLAALDAAVALAGGLIGVVVALQLDLVLRLMQRANTDATQLRLMGQILGSGVLAPPLASLARGLADLTATASSPLLVLAGTELEDARRYLQRLHDGQTVLSDGDLSLMLDQIRNVVKTIHATTFSEVDYDWWTCPGGQTYLDVNGEAIARGALVERILVYETWDERVVHLAHDQIARGVNLFRVCIRDLPPELLRNFVVYDRQFLVEDEMNLDGSITGCLHAVNEVTVRGALEAFQRVLVKAEKVAL
jgi:hypothetical protein